MKKLFIFFILFSLLTPFTSAKEFNKNEINEIKVVLNKHNRALKNHDFKTFQTFYSKDYMSADGFNVEDLTKMVEKTYNTYKNIKYETKVNSITTFDNIAIAQVSDRTTAKLYPQDNKKYNKKDKSKIGLLDGKSVYSIYLAKKGDSWRIIYDDIIMEETSLKYGIAKDLDINLNTPLFIKQGEPYDISLTMNKPQDVIALGAISKEEISYPPKDYQEKFRKIPPEGLLERIVKANKRNLDEYAIASIGFTKISTNDDSSKAKIEILGMAYVLKRVTMEKDKKFIKEL